MERIGGRRGGVHEKIDLQEKPRRKPRRKARRIDGETHSCIPTQLVPFDGEGVVDQRKGTSRASKSWQESRDYPAKHSEAEEVEEKRGKE